MLIEALSTPGREVNAATLLLAAMGAHDRKGQPLASEFELANPAEFLLVNQIVAPALRAMVPPAATDNAAIFGTRTAAGEPDDVANLAREVADLRRKVDEQQDTINRLRRRRK
jgi:hypothetical protein